MDRLIQQPVVASPLDDKTDIKLFPHLKTIFRNCQCVCARVCVRACMCVCGGGGGEERWGEIERGTVWMCVCGGGWGLYGCRCGCEGIG